MFRNVLIAAVAMIGLVTTTLAIGAERGTRDEAVAMVERAIAQFEAEGLEALVASVNAQDPRYLDRDLYVYINSQTGQSVAHAARPALVGAELWDVQDPDGLFFIREIAKFASKNQTGWVDYKNADPKTGSIKAKSAYVYALDANHTLGVGVYID